MTGRRRRGSPSQTLAALSVAGAAYSLQQTMVVPALPTFAAEFDTTTAWATWTFTAFMLASTVATPLLGKLGDKYGKERVLTISLGLFFAGCTGAAAAWDLWSLIGFRALQGAGGAVFPLGYAIIKNNLPTERVGSGIGAMSSMLAIGSAVGLVASGFVLDHLSWRWIFVIGAVGVGLAAVLVRLLIPASPQRTSSGLDVLGALLLSGTLISLLLALTNAATWGWTSPGVLALLAAGAVLLVAWAAVERRVPDPIVDLGAFADRHVLLTNVCTFFFGMPIFAALVLVVDFVQAPGEASGPLAAAVDYGFAASSTTTGLLLLLSGALPGLLVTGSAGRLARRFGPERVLLGAAVLTTAGVGSLAVFHDALWQIAIGMVLVGASTPLGVATIAMLIVDAVPPTDAAVSSSVNMVVRTVGGVIGAQLATTLLAAETIGASTIPTERAYSLALGMVAAMAALAAGAALLLCLTGRTTRSGRIDDSNVPTQSSR